MGYSCFGNEKYGQTISLNNGFILYTFCKECINILKSRAAILENVWRCLGV
jgi:hypothetical protein